MSESSRSTVYRALSANYNQRVLVPRRTFLEHSATVGAALSGFVETALARAPQTDLAGGRLLGTIPLGRFDNRPTPPLERVLGTGLDARQFTDLSTLTGDTLVIPNSRFYIRTVSPLQARQSDSWIVRVGGRVQRELALPLDAIRTLARPAGAHLLECAGNNDPANFGLMSAAEWSGVPVATLLDRVTPLSGAWRVRVTGVDHAASSSSSVAGAAWVFSRDDLERTGAFLATEMNGGALPPDHGYPVRLVVPGWYGCTCIKWVSGVELVPDDVAATSQMQEFAARTHQEGSPQRALDFAPPVIDLAATPVRVERWIAGGRLVYRVVGIMWGGSKPTNALTIRFRHNQPFVAVDECVRPASTRTWSLWSHLWRPESPGRYQIVLRANDSTIRTRRLDVFFYTREVQIDDV
jgi:DMSO/TMAO reductase YedYZ molybdopterin-dependent catalytic subunit